MAFGLEDTAPELWEAVVAYEDGDYEALRVHETLCEKDKEIFWEEIRRVEEKQFKKVRLEMAIEKKNEPPKRYYWGTAEEEMAARRWEGAILARQEV